MTKDGLREKVSRDLHRLYDGVLAEPVPPEFKELLARLK
jgi:hypothetical protein